MRYSLLSLVVAALVLGAMVGMNVRGVRTYENMVRRSAVGMYGWPLPFYPRTCLVFSSADRNENIADRLPTEETRWNGEPEMGGGNFRMIPMLIDMLVALDLAVFAGVLCELFIHRKMLLCAVAERHRCGIAIRKTS